MARIPNISVVESKPWQTIQGPCAVKIGAIASENPSGLGATLTSIGLTDSNVELNANIENALISSDQLYSPHSSVELSWAIQIVLSIAQVNSWNFALALTYDQDVVSGSGMLTFDGQLPSPYRCVRIESEGMKNEADDSAVTEYVDLWKSKVMPSGAIAYGRLTKTVLPIIIHAVANSDDEVGAILVTAKIDRPYYEESLILILRTSWTGNSSVATEVGAEFRLLYVALHFDVIPTSNFTVSLDSALGSNYDTTLHTFYAGETDYFHRFNIGAIFADGDEILVSGDAGAGNCYCTIGYAVGF